MSDTDWVLKTELYEAHKQHCKALGCRPLEPATFFKRLFLANPQLLKKRRKDSTGIPRDHFNVSSLLVPVFPDPKC